MKRVVVIGGGTGTFVVLSGLKRIPDLHLTAIVPATDSGGSTGRLKDEFGYLPIGDARQCLVALADEQRQGLLRELFNFRFSKGEDGLKGHNFGNLLLTALSDILGNDLRAIEAAQDLLQIKGQVLPVAKKSCELVAEYENGVTLRGEHNIDEPPYPHDGRLAISKLYIEPAGIKTYQQVTDAIAGADLIVTGPGDLFTSLLANFVMPGMAEAVINSQAKFIYVVNLMTKFGQTYGYSAKDHFQQLAKYVGRQPDYVLVNDNDLPDNILDKYKAENAEPVRDDLPVEDWVLRADLLAREEIKTKAGDVVKRSLIRHDGCKIASILQELF